MILPHLTEHSLVHSLCMNKSLNLITAIILFHSTNLQDIIGFGVVMLAFWINSITTEEFPSTIQMYCPSSPSSSCLIVRVDLRLGTMFPLEFSKEVELLRLTTYFSGHEESMGMLLLFSHIGGAVDLRKPCILQVNITRPSSK